MPAGPCLNDSLTAGISAVRRKSLPRLTRTDIGWWLPGSNGEPDQMTVTIP